MTHTQYLSNKFSIATLISRAALAALLVLTSIAPVFADEPSSKIHLSADAHDPGKPLVHFWSTCVGAGRANEGLRASWLEQLKLAHDACGFRYVRFHGLFHDDMFVYHEHDGQPIYNFQYIDDLFDRMLVIGVRPFVELSFSPSDLATIKATNFWWNANGSPPNDYGKWAALVDHFVRHCVDRYGIDEVRTWYFEVWNEPNLRSFFRGTQAQYFDLYKVTAQAIKAVDSSLRVGGPATSNFRVIYGPGGQAATQKSDPTVADVDALTWEPVWVTDFLMYCHDNALPVDFVSTHPYPQDFPFDDGKGGKIHVKRGIDATRHDLQILRQLVDAGPYPQAKIELTEWSSSPSSRDFTHDCLPAATFVVKTNLESSGLVDALSYWTFTDVFEEKGAGDTIFHGGFGLINYQGIVKPTFHAYRFLNALGDEVLSKEIGGIVTRDSKTGRIAALVYHYPPQVKISLPTSNSLTQAEQMLDQGTPAALEIELTGLPPRTSLLIETLDKEHGNAVAAWQSMGKPEPPTREQAASLRIAAQATQQDLIQADESGTVKIHRTIEPWSLVLIQQQ